jgi:hypothetical protein
MFFLRRVLAALYAPALRLQGKEANNISPVVKILSGSEGSTTHGGGFVKGVRGRARHGLVVVRQAHDMVVVTLSLSKGRMQRNAAYELFPKLPGFAISAIIV